jgi:exonuclease III
LLEKDILHFSNLGEIVLMGDLNGRTKRNPDYILHDSAKFMPHNRQYSTDLSLPPRKNLDVTLNNRGNQILDLCISAKLRILNGRKPGDSLGYFTCFQYNGQSTVDYGIASESFFESVLYFHVHKELSELSDHCQISMAFKCGNIKEQSPQKVTFHKIPDRFKWTSESAALFQQALSTNSTQNELSAFLFRR